MAATNEPDIDFYSINLVAITWKLRREGVIRGSYQKQLVRLGDGVSIALLKILDERSLLDASTVRSILPLIRDAFSDPKFIVQKIDKKPGVTTLLLDYLQRVVTDADVQQDVRQTMEFIKSRT